MSNITINLNLEQELEKAYAEYDKQKEEAIKQARQKIADGTISFVESVKTINELINLLEGKF